MRPQPRHLRRRHHLANAHPADEAVISIDSAVTESKYAFAETVERLVEGIAATGATLFARIDQRAAAESAGLTLRPTTLLVFGNPKAGTLLMNAHPLAALDLPLKFLIWEEAERVSVAHVPARALAARYDIPSNDPVLALLQGALDALAERISR